MKHDISDYTLTTYVSTDVLNEENLQIILHHKQVLGKRFGFICKTLYHVFVCLLAHIVGKLWGLFTGSQDLDSSEFYFGEWWQLRCSQTQLRPRAVKRSRQKLGEGQWIRERLNDSDDSESEGQRQSQTVWASSRGHFSSTGDSLLILMSIILLGNEAETVFTKTDDPWNDP